MATATSAERLTFGALLKRYRRAIGISQETLAERAGYSVGYISKLERATRLPVPATVELLADALALTGPERDALREALRTPHKLQRVPSTGQLTPSPPPPLVDRTHEVAYLERYLSGHGRPVLLFAGEPGIGKTRLLQEAATQGESRGWCVLVGASRQRYDQGYYAPVLSALETYIHSQPPAQLRDDLQGCKWLVRLLPELEELAGVPMPTWEFPPEQARRLMFSAVRRFLANIAGPAGTLLVLDNLQSITPDGADLLRAVVPGSAHEPLRIIGAYRNTESCANDALNALLAELAHERLVKRLIVGPLGPEAARELLDTLLAETEPPADGSDWREWALQKAAGVPFYEVCFADGLRAGAIDHTSPVDSLPWEIAQTVRQRVAALPPCAQLMLQIVVVAGHTVPRTLLLPVATQLGCDETEAAQALDTACRARLLVAVGDDGYAVTHTLIQDVVEKDLGPAQRAQLHQMIAEAMEHGQSRPAAEILAEHYTRAGGHDKAPAYLKEAAGKEEAAHAYATAADHYRELAARLDALGRAEEAAWAREHLGTMLCHMGQYKRALQELEQALEAYHRAGDYEGQGRAAAQIGQVHCNSGTPEEGITRLQRELLGTARLSSHGSAAMYNALGQLFYLTGRYADELSAAERASELAVASRDRAYRATAEVERATALGLLGRTDAGLHVLENQAIPLARAAGDAWILAHALDLAAHAHLMRGAFDRAMHYAERALEVVTRWDDPRITAFKLSKRGVIAFYSGDWDIARADTERAVALIRDEKAPWWMSYVLIARGEVCLSTGLREEAASVIKEGIALAERNGDLHTLRAAHGLLAESDLLEGRAGQARGRLEPLLDRPGQRESDVTRLLPLLAWAFLETDDVHQAEALMESSIERATDDGLHLVLADAVRIQALTAMRRRGWREAADASEGALSLSRNMHYPYAEAKAQYVYGLVDSRQGKTEQAHKRLEAARTILGRLGERLYARYVEQALAELDHR